MTGNSHQRRIRRRVQECADRIYDLPLPSEMKRVSQKFVAYLLVWIGLAGLLGAAALWLWP
jgi:hypothetical protein